MYEAYKLNDDLTYEKFSTDDPAEYASFFDNAEKRRIIQTILTSDDGSQITVSTVFLVIDHNWTGKGLPVLFETMVFAENYPDIDQDMERFSIAEMAIIYHENLVSQIMNNHGMTIKSEIKHNYLETINDRT